MPLLAFALTYGSFGDIKETSRWRSSDEIQKVLKVLECHRADIATLISLLQTDSPPDAQQAGLVPFAHGQAMRRDCTIEGPFSPISAQMADHRAALSGQLQLLLVALSIDGQQQLQRMASQIQATTARQISDAESNIMQRLIQGMNLSYPLGRSIPISLAHCGDFEVSRGDYNLYLPEGTIIRRVDFARTVKSGQLDMSIIKRPQFRYAPKVEKKPKDTGNEWTHWTKGDETRTQDQEKEDTDLFRLVEIQAIHEAS
ncbi:hypothetical protein B0H14DRAFT_2963786 [Mycena olivaceomarginata]|nr:hypothetical protein B0H14DRAFT_2963786 [Mycena olivaceomarginata]